MSGLCVALTKEYQSGSDQVLSLMPFDPVLIFCGSKDRLVDALLDTCMLLVRHRLLEEDLGAVVLRQYSEVSGHFRQKWQSQSTDAPVIDYILSLWLSYPHWQRCAELFKVLQMVFCGTLRSLYKVDFLDCGSTAVTELEMVSSLNFVRSWVSSNFVGRNRPSLSGLLRHCESTDMQVSRLHNLERCRPWDQVLKKGLNDTHDLCGRMLSGETMEVSTITIDGYRSSVCLQLEHLEKTIASPRPRGKNAVKSLQRNSPVVPLIIDESGHSTSSSKVRPKSQSSVAIAPKTRGRSRSTGVSSRFSPAMRNRGRRTGCVLMQIRQRRVAVLDSSDTSPEKGSGQCRVSGSKLRGAKRGKRPTVAYTSEDL